MLQKVIGASVKSQFLNILQERGFINQATDLDALDNLLSREKIVAYSGFDCTGPSLHVGSLVPIMMLRHLQNSGHTAIVLIGGSTTRIGDPSGKTETRLLLTDQQINSNMKSLKKNFKSFIGSRSATKKTIFLNNSQWLSKLNYISFLREIGSHFTINKMLTLESVKLRLDREQPLSFLEFNYMILQAYDFLQLHRHKRCLLQLGGSDQWGNIVNGVDLIRRITGKQTFGLTGPMITTATGEKMGKTAQGAIWLAPELLSDFDYWQFWRNTRDEDVGKFLRLFTEISISEIARLEKLKGSELNYAKNILADEATALCRGKSAALKSRLAAEKIFDHSPQSLLKEFITISIPLSAAPVSNVDYLVKAGICQSRNQARQLILQGGIHFNDKKITNPLGKDFIGETMTIKKGKKHYYQVRIK